MGLLDSNIVRASYLHKELTFSNKSLSSTGFIDGIGGINCSDYNSLQLKITFSGSGTHNLTVRGAVTNSGFNLLQVFNARTLKRVDSVTENGEYIVNTSNVNWFGIYNGTSVNETVTISVEMKTLPDVPVPVYEQPYTSNSITINYNDTGSAGTIANVDNKKCLVVKYSKSGGDGIGLKISPFSTYFGSLPVYGADGTLYRNFPAENNGLYYVDISGIPLIYLYRSAKNTSTTTTGTFEYYITDNIPSFLKNERPVQLIKEAEFTSTGSITISNDVTPYYKYFFIRGYYLVGNTETSVDVTLRISDRSYFGTNKHTISSDIIYEHTNKDSFRTEWIENRYDGDLYLHATLANTTTDGILYLKLYGVR